MVTSILIYYITKYIVMKDESLSFSNEKFGLVCVFAIFLFSYYLILLFYQSLYPFYIKTLPGVLFSFIIL